MDTLGGQLSGHDGLDTDPGDLDTGSRAPVVGNDERRMQVRAYNFWASLLGTRTFPDIADLRPETLPDFGPRSVLLDFTQGDVTDTKITEAGGGIENPAIAYLGALLAQECGADGPLRHIQDVPSRSLLSRITDHYMQILANEAPIGFEAEFVNHAGVTILYRGILLPFSRDGARIDFIYGVINWKERADTVDSDPPVRTRSRDARPAMLRGPEPLTEWADGPVDLGLPVPGAYAPIELPRPGFAMDAEPTSFTHEEMGLADWLASARELALLARGSEERSHQALYDAIGRAYDFALAAIEAPEDFAELVEDAGLKVQERAPLMPLVKLVFGADYDKTRLAEFTTAIAHGQRLGMGRGMLADHLGATPGGLKALVREERRLRREDGGKTAAPLGNREKLVRGLRAIEARPMAALARDGEEFTVLVARRLEGGEVVLVGEVSGDEALLQRAARHLLG
ncbi:hypothetical protein [Novosphingobium sp. BL-52-GroH]|uniref:hypothetical protein n=1 Tax=Novosphingobium sp. BL-52-GroH TaxID=3349877 RepID=UPI00384D10E6